MDLDPSLQELLTTLSANAVVLAALALGLVFYGYLADKVIFEAGGCLQTEKFGPLDALAAALLTALFAVPVMMAISASKVVPTQTLPKAGEMIASVLLSTVFLLGIVGAVLAGLYARRIRWREVFGLDRQSPGTVLGYAVLLLFLATPLINYALQISWLFLLAGGSEDHSSQDLVRFLAASDSHAARWVVAASAVVAAPVLEEFIFRGYLYGVVRRYAGVTVGILFNATLFAAIHLHLPSFGGLFVLAVCLTLAYEWTGSIFVPITMHALFNAESVVALLQGGTHG